MAPEALGQVGGDGGFLANAVWEREGGWKNGVCEQASEAARGGSGATVPGAGGDGGLGGGEVGEDRAGQERELWEALAGLGCGDEGAGGAEHLLGGERELLDGPAVQVEVAQRACRDGQRGGEDQRLGPARIVDRPPGGRWGWSGGRPAAPGRPTTRRGRPRRPPARSRCDPVASRPTPGPDRSGQAGGSARPARVGAHAPDTSGRLARRPVTFFAARTTYRVAPASWSCRISKPASSTSTSLSVIACTAARSSARSWAAVLGSFGSARTSASGSPSRCVPTLPTRATIPTGIAGSALPAGPW